MSIFSASGTATPMKNVNASTGSPLIQQLLTQIQNQQMQNQQPQPIQPQIFQSQPKAQLGLPLVLQQLYGPEAGAMIQQPVDPAPQGGFTTSPGFRPAIGVPQGGINNIAFAPGYGSSILNPGIRTADFRDRDGDGIDDRDQIGPGQPKFRFADFSLADLGVGSTATLPTLAQLAAFNPIANSYALAGFTVGEIAAMPEFADFGASVGSDVTGLPATTQPMGPTKAGDGKANLDRFREMQERNKLRDEIEKFGFGIPEREEPTLPGFLGVVEGFLKNIDTEMAIDKVMKDIDASKPFGVNQFGLGSDYKGASDPDIDRDPEDFKTPTIGPSAVDDDLGKTPKGDGPKGDGPGAGAGSGKGCFVKGTMIEMADGTEKEITTITVGEQTKGGVVEAKLEFMPTQIYNYKGVEVSGSHLVMENNQFVKVEDSKRSVLTDKIEPVYCFETSDNRIWVKGIEFGDYLTGSHDQWQPHIDAMLATVNKELNGNI